MLIPTGQGKGNITEQGRLPPFEPPYQSLFLQCHWATHKKSGSCVTMQDHYFAPGIQALPGPRQPESSLWALDWQWHCSSTLECPMFSAQRNSFSKQVLSLPGLIRHAADRKDELYLRLQISQLSETRLKKKKPQDPHKNCQSHGLTLATHL